MGRWVPAAPCPHRPTLKVGMHELPMGSPVPLLACSWSPLGMDPSTQHWVLMGGCQEVGVLQGLPPDGTSSLLFPDNRLTPRLVAPRGTGRRAVSVHEEQLREPECPAELGSKWGLEWDPEPPLHPMPEEAGSGIVASTYMVGTAWLSWWGTTCGAGVMDDGIVTLGRSQGDRALALGSAPASSRAAQACRQKGGRSQAAAPHRNVGLGCVSLSGHRPPAPAAVACAQTEDQARLPPGAGAQAQTVLGCCR